MESAQTKDDGHTAELGVQLALIRRLVPVVESPRGSEPAVEVRVDDLFEETSELRHLLTYIPLSLRVVPARRGVSYQSN